MPLLPSNKRRQDLVYETMELARDFGIPWQSPAEAAQLAYNFLLTDKPLSPNRVEPILGRFRTNYDIAESARFRLIVGADPNEYDSWEGPLPPDQTRDIDGLRSRLRFRLVEPPSIDGEVAELMRRYPAPERSFSKVVLDGLGILPPHAPADTA